MNDIPFLRNLGTDRLPHSGRNLLSHLVGTMNIVQRWGCDENTSKAALFHSVYGTEFFKGTPLTYEDRPRVVRQIGSAAERIVYVFGAMERNSLYKAMDAFATGDEKLYIEDRNSPARIEVSTDEFRSLVMILWANAVEQAPCKGKHATRHAVEQCTRFLTFEAIRELHAYTAGLDTLLDEKDVGLLSSSFSKCWPDQPFFCHGHVKRLAGLADFDLEQLSHMPRRFTKSFQRTPDGSHTSVPIQPGQEREHFDQGRTVYLHSIHAPTIDAWVSGIDRDLGILPGATRVSAFVSKHGDGLAAHYDPNDNFVCQAKGTKRWRVAKTARVPFAITGHTVGAPASRQVRAELGGEPPTAMPEPWEEIVMEPGDVLFMPRGIWHDTETVSDESIHFNIQTGLPTWKDAVDFVLSTTLVLHDEEFRRPILEAEMSRDVLQEKIQKLVDVLHREGPYFNVEEFRQFLARRRYV